MSQVPVFLFAFANDREGSFLRSIAEEQRIVSQALAGLADKKLVEVEILSNARAEDIFAAFRRFGKRVKGFHYGGHANDLEILLTDAPDGMDVGAFAEYLGSRDSLELVFMNGCATGAQRPVLEAAGIPNLILTSAKIGDQAACTFAGEFYQNLASGNPIKPSFVEASAAVKSTQSELFRSLDWEGKEIAPPDDELPWKLFQDPSADPNWKLRTKKDRRPLFLGAALILVVAALAFIFKPDPKPFDFTLLVQDPQGKALPALARGDTLITPDPALTMRKERAKVGLETESGKQIWGEFDREGNVFFRQLDPTFEGQKANLLLESPSGFWELSDPNSQVELSEGTAAIAIARSEKLCQVRGRVLNGKNQPVGKALIQIKSLPEGPEVLGQTQSEADGRFEVNIPRSDCARQYIALSEIQGTVITYRDTIYPETGEVFLILNP